MDPSSRTIVLFQNRRNLGRIFVEHAVNPRRDFQRGPWSFSKGETECRKSKKRTFPSLFLYDGREKMFQIRGGPRPKNCPVLVKN